jgi:hypothetical protein
MLADPTGTIQPAGVNTLDNRFILAPQGQTCDAFCSSLGKKDAYFQGFFGPDAHLGNATSLCAAKTAEGFLPGYQFRGKEAECLVAVNGGVVAEEEYGCFCLESTQTQGLARSDGVSCSTACADTRTTTSADTAATYGLAETQGVSATQGASEFTCLPFNSDGQYEYTFFGYTNGTATANPSCTAVYGEEVVEADAYSCFCVFDKLPKASGTSSATANSGSIQTASIEG